MVNAAGCCIARRDPRGFTLIELTLAMLLLGVGLLALVGALVHALDEAQRARLRHVALRLAESTADSVVATAGTTAAAGVRRAGPVRIDWSPEPCAAGTCLRLVGTMPGHPGDSVTLLVRAGAAVATP